MPSRKSLDRTNGEDLDHDKRHKELLSETAAAAQCAANRRDDTEQHEHPAFAGAANGCRLEGERSTGRGDLRADGGHAASGRVNDPNKLDRRPPWKRQPGRARYAVRAKPKDATAARMTSSNACSMNASRSLASRVRTRAATRPDRTGTSASLLTG